MKTLPRLRLEPRPSRIARVTLLLAATTTGILIAVLPLGWPFSVAGLVAVIGISADGLRRCCGRRVPALLHVGLDRRIAVSDRTGRSRAGAIGDDSYVGAMLTTIVWRADGEPWWHPPDVILILQDTLPDDDFRRLRVFLRYGRGASVDETSAVDAR